MTNRSESQTERRRVRTHTVVLGLLCAAHLAHPFPAAADIVDRTRADTDWLAGYQTRLAGTAPHDAASQALLEKVRAVPGIRVWTHEFDVVMPEFQEAHLTVTAGTFQGRHRIYPLWPALGRLCTTPADGLSGRLVYVGKASYAELPARSLRGQIAVMEMTGRDNWMRAYNAGATAIVLLGSPEVTASEAGLHFARVPINVPRFYLPPGPLAAALRGAESMAGKLYARARWRTTRACNIYALLKPRAQGAPRRAVAVAVPYDAVGIVPELAPAADTAVDAALVLNVLRAFAENPPDRPFLFAFVDAYSMNQLGIREMLSAFGVPKEDRDVQLKDDRKCRDEYEEHEALAANLDKLGEAAVDSLFERENKDLFRYVKDEVAREVIVIEAELLPLRLKRHRLTGETATAAQARVDKLAARRGEFFAAQLQLLTKVPIEEQLRPLANTLWQRARRRIARQLEEAANVFKVHEYQDSFRIDLIEELRLRELQGREDRDEEKLERPIEFLLNIDLSDAGVAAGPSLYCHYLGHDEKINSKDFRDWLKRAYKEEGDDVWPVRIRNGLNLAPILRTDDDVTSHTIGTVANVTSPAQSFGIAAMTWATLDAFRTRADTPNDTPENLDWIRLTPQIEVTWALLKRLAYPPAGKPAFAQETKVMSRWRIVRGTIVDVSPGEPVPRLPMQGYLTTLVNGNAGAGRAGVRWRPNCAGLRPQEYKLTGVDGRFRVEALPGHARRWSVLRYFVQSFQFAEDGRIVRAINMNKVGKGVRLNIDIQSADASPLRAVTFTCEEVAGVDFTDPRFLRALGQSSLLDAVRGGKPQRLNFSIYGNLLSAFVEPGTRWQFILRLGTTQNRMALVNMATPEEAAHLTVREAMRGFPAGERLPDWPLRVALQDFWNLDERRLLDYSKAGITSKAVQQIRDRTRKLMAEGDEAAERDDGLGFYKATVGAMANEVRAYQAIRYLANDVIRAAVFLLLAIIPFSFALERLIIATPHIYRQLAGITVTFVVMTAILWSFHPAFRISNQPLMIVMAFGIIAMSVVVISVVFSRFETSLEEMRSGRAESSGARTSRSGVLSSAVRLGIANMRKRKLRTALTGTTVVLITFALLCFTSVSTYVGHKQYSVEAQSPYTGLVVRQPSTRAMPEQARSYLQAFFGRNRTVVPRYWCSASVWTPDWKLHMRDRQTGQQISIKAALGLVGAESELTGIDKVLPNWQEFAERGGCYLASETAEELGVKPGDEVILMGAALRLVGVFGGTRLSSEVRGLDGQSILPYDYSLKGREQRRNIGSSWVMLVQSQMDSAEGFEPEEDLDFVVPSSLVIVPAAFLRDKPSSTLRSLSVRMDSLEQASETAMELARRLAFLIYFGSPEGVSVMAATGLKPRAPKSLILPLLIAGLIIFNTMLSSIAERKREIHVYTSLGLAPLHVGVLFLAEAITYGLMGSIFGYVVGQGLASLLSELGLLGGITLNYSGTQAIATMVMVLVVVILSSLVPAFMAGKIASPSHEMSWKVPLPENDRIRDTLPFTVTAKAANGVVNFLHEYLEAHSEGSIGNFSTDRLRLFKNKLGGHDVLGIEGTIWLAPYDLGVRQDVKLAIRATDEEDVCEIDIELFRGSGQVRNWWKLNRVFLGDLRKQLLGWRNVKTERVLQYIADAQGMLAGVES